MFEVWARNVKTRRYEYLCSFDDIRNKYFMMDQVDAEKYCEVMIIKGKGMEQSLEMYVEFKKVENEKKSNKELKEKTRSRTKSI